jgi:hypothetical protein
MWSPDTGVASCLEASSEGTANASTASAFAVPVLPSKLKGWFFYRNNDDEMISTTPTAPIARPAQS